jgi:hypothetical protein
MLALSIIAASTGAALAECVTNLAYCATECDQRTKPETPDRPQCAKRCISTYERCARRELIQRDSGGVLKPGKIEAPAQQ